MSACEERLLAYVARSAASRAGRTLVTGSLGAGKSTFVRHCCANEGACGSRCL